MSTALEAAILAAVDRLSGRLLGMRSRTRTVKYTTSGTFRPADYGLRAGDAVLVQMAGGGAGGCYYYVSAANTARRGGDAGQVVEQYVVIDDPAVPVQVVVGAGGGPGTSATVAGGASMFGALEAPGGESRHGGNVAPYYGGIGAGGPSSYTDTTLGGVARDGWARGGDASRSATRAQRPNSGDGGDVSTSGTAQSGSAGFVQVSWPEIVP